MKKIAIAVALVALVAPSSAAAHGKKHHRYAGIGVAAVACKAERSSIGKDAFQQKYANQRGRRAFVRCVKQRVVTARRSCKAERAADRDAFRAKYGKGPRQRRAFKRCVRQTVVAQAQQPAA